MENQNPKPSPFSTPITTNSAPAQTTTNHPTANVISAPPVYDVKKTRRLILAFIAIDFVLILPIIVTAFYIFNPPTLQSLDGPAVPFLTSTFAFFGTLSLTIMNAPFSAIFSRIIRERAKNLASPDKMTRILRICFTIISSIPAILLVLGFLRFIAND